MRITQMRRVFVVVLFSLLIGVIAFGQDKAPAPNKPAQSSSISSVLDRLKNDPEQAKQLQQALDILQQVANARAEDTKGDGNGKTVGDALDKGLDMAKETVVYLAGKIEEVAPQVWRVLVVQQYVKGATSLISPIGFLIVVLWARRTLLKWWKPLPKDDDPNEPLFVPGHEDPVPTHKGVRGFFTVLVPLFLLVIGGIWFYSSITDAVGYFINPNYYALKDIIALVRSPGSF